jgi:hypothetical protein
VGGKQGEVGEETEDEGRGELKGSGEVTDTKGKVTDIVVRDKIVDILVLLERKKRRMEKRLERSEVKAV